MKGRDPRNLSIRGDTIYSSIKSNSSLKLGTILMILAVISSAMVVLFVLHMETDNSSAQIIDSGQCGPDAMYNIYSGGILEIKGSGEMYSYDTTHAPWYDCRDEITQIIITNDISKLGAGAFLDCKNLTELYIPITLNAVVSDKNPAFAGCCSLERVNFTCGDGGYGYNYAAYEVSDSWYQHTPWYQSRDTLKGIYLIHGIKGIGSDAFRELNITSIELPESVVHLGNHCFFNCTKLTDLTLPVSLNSFGSNEKYLAFNGCMAVQKVTFTKGNGVPYDYYGSWSAVYGLAPWNRNSDIAKTIIISNDVPELGLCTFYHCNIKELTIPICIQLVDDDAFHGPYNNLEKVTFTKGNGTSSNYCDYFIDRAFDDCPWNQAPNLKTVIVEEGITRIGHNGFYKCTTENLILPNSLASFGEKAFYKCTIKNLTIPISLNATWLDRLSAFSDVSGIETINFTPGSGYGFDYAAYKGNNCWYQQTPWYQCRSTLKEINFAEGITHIGSDAFRELNITSLVIPNSVESLGCHAFYNMKELSSLTLPITLDSVGSTKYPAFNQDNNISKLRYTAGTNGIGHDYTNCVPFWNYSHDNNFTVTIDKGIEYIGTNTLSTFIFADADGQRLDPTAAHLSGHIFQGSDSQLHLIGDSQDQPLDATITGCIPEVGLIDSVDFHKKVSSGI